MNHYTYMLTIKSPTDSRRLYIGVRTCKSKPEEDTTYLGSCRPLKAWIKTNGSDNVEKIILARWQTRQDALSHEILLHDCFDVGRNQEFWNQAKQVAHGFDTTGTVGKSRGIKLPPERVEFMRTLAIGNTNRRGKKHTESAIEKNRIAHIGKAYHNMPHSEETKQKISLSKKGQRSSVRTEFSQGHVPWNKGKQVSLETRLKISNSLKKYNAKDL